jgi:hypothetical protein
MRWANPFRNLAYPQGYRKTGDECAPAACTVSERSMETERLFDRSKERVANQEPMKRA